MRFPSISRRWLIAGGIGVGLLVLTVVGFAVVYPRVGAWMIRDKVGGKLARKLGRDVKIGAINVSFGHAVLRDLDIRGPLDGDTPLVHIDRIDVDFDAWSSLVGKVVVGDTKIDGVIATIRRDPDGRDNVQDIFERTRAEHRSELGDSFGSLRPKRIMVVHARMFADDELTGTTVLVADGDATWTAKGMLAHVRGLTGSTIGAPVATVATIEVRKLAGAAPIVTVDGGELSLWPRMALSGIGGQIVANPDQPGRYLIDLAGGYGGAPGRLWTAKGELDPQAVTASIDLEAAKFQLDRLAPILEHSAVVDYQATSIDTKFHIDIDRAGAKFAGAFHLRGLNVGHPYIADKEVHDLDLSGQIAGTFDRAWRKLDLTRGDFIARNVPFSVTGSAIAPRNFVLPEAPPRKNADGTERTPPMRGPHGIQNLQLRLVIPPIDCQHMLDAIPVEMVPYMAGYRLRGVFDADIQTVVDWGDIDALELGGKIAINHCRVIDEPADSPKRLKDEFEQYVETEKGEWQSFIVGPTNPDFVPLDQISPFLLKSIQSSEDFGFYKHHGFIPSEFRTALINNLKRGKFVQGASSITMQMVKNVLLYREKTLARKLQELYLTWHVENTLDKDRIFEIYLNVIEFGAGLYGIGPAAHYYFGKPAKDLNPVEAAFFSSILPDPKGRQIQYCENTLTKWTTNKIEHILANMFKRKQLTQEEYDKAIVTPLLFVKDESETEEECLKRVKKAIKNARSTNPLKKDPEPPPAPAPKKSHHGKKSHHE